MKKRLLSLALAMALCVGLVIPALAADASGLDAKTAQANVDILTAGPYQITGDDYVLSFDAAKVEKREVMVQFEDMEGYALPYRSETVILVKLRPGSNIAVSGGLSSPEYYGDGRPCVMANPGKIVDSTHFEAGEVGGITSVFIAGPVEDTFKNPGEMFWPPTTQNNQELYFIFLDTETASEPPAASFADVPANAYYADAVTWAVGKGITNGTGTNTFSPENTCNNAEILTFIWRAKGQPEPAISNPFSNVQSSDYYYKAALWAYQNGLVTGSSFQASAPCTRSMAVAYLWKAAGSPAAGASHFSDVPASASYATAVAWAVNQGITNGDGAGTFSPDKTCTRGQIATFLYRALA